MFFPRLDEVCKQKKSLLCIGLDIDIERIPPFLLTELDPLFYFNRAIVEATHDCAAAYKLNIAFYEALGIPGWDLLERTLSIMPPNVMIIADAKRGDIGNSSRKYAETFFKTFAFDAITVNPYMGFDALQPFLEYEDKGIYVLGLTSNTGALDFQYLKVENEMPLYLKVAEKVVEWNFVYGNLGLVVGGTHANEVAQIREQAPQIPFLVPGIGAQGGNLELAVKNAVSHDGRGALFNASRSIIYASSGHDFAEVAHERAHHLKEQINLILSLNNNLGFWDEN